MILTQIKTQSPFNFLCRTAIKADMGTHMNTPASQTTLPVYHKPDLQLRRPCKYTLKYSFIA